MTCLYGCGNPVDVESTEVHARNGELLGRICDDCDNALIATEAALNGAGT